MLFTRLWLAVATIAVLTTPAAAQYSTVTSPFHSVGDSFYEHIGVDFGFRSGNFFFQQNGAGQALPPFGGFTPGAGAELGFNVGDAFFRISAAQGSRRSFVSQAPSVTLSNGIPGGIFDTMQSPFVIGVIPVVGDEPQAPNPLLQRLQQARQAPQPSEAAAPAAPPQQPAAPAADPFGNKLAAAQESTAGQPALSVAEIRALRAGQQGDQQREARGYLERGRQAEADGKPNVARIYYQQGARRASGALRDELLERIEAVSKSR